MARIRITGFFSKWQIIVNAIILSVIALVLAQALINELDISAFPGCKIIGTEPQNILVIELNNPDHTDQNCQDAGQVIYNICRKGYKVKVANWTLDPNQVIDLEKAYRLALGY